MSLSTFRADKDSSVNKQLAAEEVKRTERNNIKQFELDLISQKIKNEKFMMEAKVKKEAEEKKAEDAKSAQEKEKKKSSEIQFTDVKKEPTVSIRRSKMPPPRYSKLSFFFSIPSLKAKGKNNSRVYRAIIPNAVA